MLWRAQHAQEAPLSDTITIAHAGSLINVLTRELGPAFTRSTGYTWTNIAGPAVGLANRIRSGAIAPDIYLSADAEVNQVLMGPQNGDKVRWFAVVAGTRMVLAYSPKSRYKPDLDAAAAGQAHWFEVLLSPDFVFRRSDPRTDPGGYRTVFVFQLAEHFYGRTGLREQILRGDDNEEQMSMGSLQSLVDGTVDAAMFYVTIARDLGLPFIQLPDAIDLSNPALAAQYRTAHYTNPLGQTFHGTPAVYSLTIPTDAQNPAGAEAFAAFALSSAGRAIFQKHGFLEANTLFGGDHEAVPETLRLLIQGTYPNSMID
jgi:molybdate/tungstate transport system substrate-binding protein